jgi:hypothetical protein
MNLSRVRSPAWAVRNLELRLDRVRAKVFTDGIARQARTPGNLTDRHMLAYASDG